MGIKDDVVSAGAKWADMPAFWEAIRFGAGGGGYTSLLS
jgi:hypothetical protein